MLVVYCIMDLDGEYGEGDIGIAELEHHRDPKFLPFHTYCQSVWLVPGTWEE